MTPRGVQVVGAGAITLAALFGALLFHSRHEGELSRLRTVYRTESKAESALVVQRLEDRLGAIYQGIRTMARLPGVRAIQRHAENFGKETDAHQAMQEIYNSLASTVALSEVYVVPKDLDSARLDPVTGSPEAPITTFDEFIVDEKKPDPSAGESGAQELPEEEGYEYRAMQVQNQWFAGRYAKESTISFSSAERTLDYPAIASSLLVTCDNDTGGYRKSRLDADRSGIVYSVPFYGHDGELRGMISAVLLGNVLRELLRDGPDATRAQGPQTSTGAYRVLLNRDYSLGIEPGASTPREWLPSREFIARGVADPHLIHSDVITVRIRDVFSSGWRLWVGFPDRAFWERDDVKASEQGYVTSLGVVGVLWVLGLLGATALGRRLAARAAAEARIGSRIRIAERIGDVAGHMARGAQLLAATATQLAATSAQILANVENSAQQTARASEAADRVGESMLKVRAGSEELREAARQTATSAAQAVVTAHAAAVQATHTGTTLEALRENSERIQSVIDLIRTVAEQTHLLALNATIEAARAGEAGRGFTVVAGEVKALAAETARATSRIETEVRGVRESALNSVSALQKIASAVSSIEAEQARFAGAMQERIASTDKITDNVGEAAGLASEIENMMGSAAATAGATSGDVGQLSAAIAEISQMAEEMNASVNDLGELSAAIQSEA